MKPDNKTFNKPGQTTGTGNTAPGAGNLKGGQQQTQKPQQSQWNNPNASQTGKTKPSMGGKTNKDDTRKDR